MKISDERPWTRGWHFVYRKGNQISHSMRWESDGDNRPSMKEFSETVDTEGQIEIWWFENGVWYEDKPK